MGEQTTHPCEEDLLFVLVGPFHTAQASATALRSLYPKLPWRARAEAILYGVQGESLAGNVG